MQPPVTTHNHRQPSTITHNHPKSTTTIHNYPQPSTTAHNHPKNHSQPSTTTQVLLKTAKTCHKQLCYCILDVNTETDVGFDSDMKQWYIYMRMCVCAYVLQKSLYLLFSGQLIVFVSITSNSFNVKSDDFCLLRK